MRFGGTFGPIIISFLTIAILKMEHYNHEITPIQVIYIKLNKKFLSNLLKIRLQDP